MGGATRARDDTRRAETEIRGPLEPGAIFEKYEIVRCIGTGGMGAVYEARHVRLSKRVALKTMLEGLSTKPDLVQRILREGETIARIRHPHVVDIYDVGIHEGVPYLVEEFLEGETLHDLLDRAGSLPPTPIADILVPIADALAAAHRANVVHRDLKPANIFLAHDGRGQVRPKLLDFGISKVSDRVDGPSLTKAGSVIGTPEYMAPEQIHQLPDVDGRADQYALGVVMYECITGLVPYRHQSLFELLSASVAGAFDPPHVHRADVDPDLELIVLRAMSTDRARRFADMHELVLALLPFASEKVRSQFDASGALLPSGEAPRKELSFDAPSGTVPKVLSHAATLPATPARGAHGQPQPPIESGIRRRRRPSRASLAGAGLAIAALSTGAYLTLSAPEPPPPVSTFEVTLDAQPPEAVIRLDGRVVGTGTARATLPRDGSEHVIEIRAPGHASRELLFRDSFTTHAVVLDPLPTAPVDVVAAPPPPAAPAPALVDEEREPPRAPARASRMRRRVRQTSSPSPSAAPVDIRLTR